MDIINNAISMLDSEDEKILVEGIHLTKEIAEFKTFGEQVKGQLSFYDRILGSDISDSKISELKKKLLSFISKKKGRIKAEAISSLSKFFDQSLVEFYQNALDDCLTTLLEQNACLSACILALSDCDEEIITDDLHTISDINKSVSDSIEYLTKKKDKKYPF